MPDIKKLRVSLTKNGYFKVAEVIARHQRYEILENVSGIYPGINLNTKQIANLLSADSNTGDLPEVWDDVRALDPHSIDILVFVAVVYSHHLLIGAFANGTTGHKRGTITRAAVGAKTYTNLVFSMQKLGICKAVAGSHGTAYDLSPIFLPELGPLVKRVITLKLKQTGWAPPTEDEPFLMGFYDQCEYFRFNRVLGLKVSEFRDWLEGSGGLH